MLDDYRRTTTRLGPRSATVHPVRMRILGLGLFASTGSAGFRLDRYGMSPAGIADAARSLLRR